MNIIEKAAVLCFHRDRLRSTAHPSVHALGWKDMEGQQKRFDILTAVGELSDCVVMDMGCGLGDLKPFLDEKFRNVVYLGIDHVPEFVHEANRRHGSAVNTFFHQSDFITDGLPEVDYVLASGALSYRSDNRLFPYTIIRKMYALARKGIAFNLLDEDGFVSETLLTAYNKDEVLHFCKVLAEDKAVCVTGYLPDDFTIMMYK